MLVGVTGVVRGGRLFMSRERDGRCIVAAMFFEQVMFFCVIWVVDGSC